MKLPQSILATILSVSIPLSAAASEAVTATSPDGSLEIILTLTDCAEPCYSVKYKGATVLEPSILGLESTDAQMLRGLTLKDVKIDTIDVDYSVPTIKKSHVAKKFTHAVAAFDDAKGKPAFDVEFMIADNDLAFRYNIPHTGKHAGIHLKSEDTYFNFPAGTRTFLAPQAEPLTGWKRTKPSYEENYILNAEMGNDEGAKYGYTFPTLFHSPDSLWVMVSETGVDSQYSGNRLSVHSDKGYKIEFPMPQENNHWGNVEPMFSLPGSTPWRTIAVGQTLAPVVESTITWDVVEPLYAASPELAKPGRGSWSWIMWQDNSINFDDLKAYVDLAAEMGYEYTLVDNFWDKNLTPEQLDDFLAYSRSRGVEPILWYSSSGPWNDIVQGPVGRMHRSITRKNEMKWLQEHGIKAIKVDFFGGDKQETMRLYEEILSDANDHGINVIFHGCTLPRGWERMYPNYVGSEAVLASENLVFQQSFCDNEPVHDSSISLIRNVTGAMEYGGTVLNKRFSRDNATSGNFRRTGDVFQLATAVLFQSPAQNFALAPNNLADAPEICIEFMKEIPTTWDDIHFIDGYPGKYNIMARRKGSRWLIAGINATDKPLKLDIDLSFTGAKEVTLYTDNANGIPTAKTVKVSRKGTVPVSILPAGGVVIDAR